jgi:hypothetical protein
MSEPVPDPPSPWTSPADVVFVLGKLGPRVQANTDIDLDAFVSAAHAEALDRLADAYGTRTLPAFAGDALTVLRWAEAQLAAADVLDMLRATLGDDQAEVPERLRRSAWAKLDGGVPGFRPGDPAPADGVTYPTWTSSPAHSSSTPVSNFPDPYADTLALPAGPWPVPLGGW